VSKDGQSEGAGHGPAPLPYKSTATFDQDTLPPALRREHSTKAGVWGLIRILEGELRLTYLVPPSQVVVTPDQPAVVLPQQPHYVEPFGSMRMVVEFYDKHPG
jgi:tellurite resistance-related uncharacterized protein